MDTPRPGAADRLDAVFAALADPTRRAIVTRLLAADHSVSELAAPFEMSLAAVSKHLAILARAGLVEQRRQGRTRICRLDPDALRPAAVWIEAFGAFDAEDLEILAAHLAATADTADTRTPSARYTDPGGD